jgi:membrane protease YdiL (CAAX protease family)
VTIPAYVFLAVVGLVLPLLAVQTARLLRGGPLPVPRRHFYAQTIALQCAMLAFGLFVRPDVLRAPRRPGAGAAAAVALLGAALAILTVRWPSRSDRSRNQLYELLPHDRGEMPLYLALCAAAGFAEEIVYRGVTFELLGETPLAALIASIFFALGHAIQGWKSVGAIFLFALGFHAIVHVAGSLWFAIAVHIAYDAVAGVLIPRWEKREKGGQTGSSVLP